MKGSAEEAAKHQHGIQVKETGVADTVVTSSRVDALEVRIEELEAKIEQLAAKLVVKVAEAGSKKDKAA